MYGELIPIGGGDPIPLLKSHLTLGRRESNDIVLRFGSVSGQHCELVLEQGWWFVKDLNSQNGTRVNGLRVSKKRLDPGDRLTVSRLDYEVRYSPSANGGDDHRPPDDDLFSDIMGRSLMESAGLDRKKRQAQEGRIGVRRKTDPLGDSPTPVNGIPVVRPAVDSDDAPVAEPAPVANNTSPEDDDSPDIDPGSPDSSDDDES